MPEFIEGGNEGRRIEKEKRLVKIGREAEEKFGSDLGNTFFKYTYGDELRRARWCGEELPYDRAKSRGEFAKAIVEVLEVGTKGAKELAITALLESFEVQL